MHVFNGTEQAKSLQQPDNNEDYHHHIEDAFNLAVHGDVSVYKPENNPNNNQHQ